MTSSSYIIIYCKLSALGGTIIVGFYGTCTCAKVDSRRGRGRETYHERVTHLFIEGRWKEFNHVREPEQEGGGEITEISQHHEQRTEGRVDKLYVRLTVVRHELQRGRGRGGGRERERGIMLIM